MRLLRVEVGGHARPAIQDGETVRLLPKTTPDFFGEAISIKAIERIRALNPSELQIAPKGAPILSALEDAPNIFCIGLNYLDHAKETGATPPPEPMLFNKATSSLAGPFDDLALPEHAQTLDWEAELAIVIGKPCHRVSEDAALSCVAAFATMNDLSERTWQKDRGGQFVKGKSGPGFAPLGPWLVTPDEISDVQNLRVMTRVNGETMQDGSTADMIFGVRTVISNVSQYLSFRPGDVIATGTPAGVALGMKPPRWIRKGDVIEVEVEGLGAQRTMIV